MSSQRKEGTRGEGKNAKVSNLFISPEESDSRLPANNPLWLLRFLRNSRASASYFCLSLPATPPRHPSLLTPHPHPHPKSALSEAAFQIYCNSPSSFPLFPHFPPSSPCISSSNQTCTGLCLPRPPKIKKKKPFTLSLSLSLFAFKAFSLRMF